MVFQATGRNPARFGPTRRSRLATNGSLNSPPLTRRWVFQADPRACRRPTKAERFVTCRPWQRRGGCGCTCELHAHVGNLKLGDLAHAG